MGMAFLRASLGLALVVGLFAALSTIRSGGPEDGPVMLGDPGHQESDRWPAGDERTNAELGREALPAPRYHIAPDPGGEPGAGKDSESVMNAAPAPGDTTVQVLDGVGSSSRLNALVAALEDLGYDVVATNPAGTDYAATTVFYSEGHETAAAALQARDPRVVESHLNLDFSEAVDLHVVMGLDWQP